MIFEQYCLGLLAGPFPDYLYIDHASARGICACVYRYSSREFEDSGYVQASIPASSAMRLGVFVLVLLLLNLESPCEAMEKPFQDLNVGADHHAINMTGFIITYTLIIVNSPDCEPSLIDDFPVRVQYRMISNGDGEQSNTSISEWMGSASPRAPGILYSSYYSYKCNKSISTSYNYPYYNY